MAQETRVHITVLGKPNVGKSSLVNALAGQELATVSELPGTTNTPTYVSAELLPLGQVMFIDTPGLREEHIADGRYIGALLRILGETDIALMVLDGAHPHMGNAEHQLITTLTLREIPFIIAVNRADMANAAALDAFLRELPESSVATSATQGTGIAELQALILEKKSLNGQRMLIGDLISAGDLVLFVTIGQRYPSPMYRELLRETLKAGAMPLLVREAELPQLMTTISRPPSLVVAEAENFERLMRLIPPDVPLTSFPVLMTRQKGNLKELVEGVHAATRLQPGSRVLIAEGCPHRPLYEQAQYTRLPMILQTLAGGPLRIDTIAGKQFPDSLRGYQAVVHCGGCQLSRTEMLRRQALCRRDGVPFINVDLLYASLSQALPRMLAPLRVLDAFGEERDEMRNADRMRIGA